METEYRLLHYLTSRLAFVSTVCETGRTIGTTDQTKVNCRPNALVCKPGPFRGYKHRPYKGTKLPSDTWANGGPRLADLWALMSSTSDKNIGLHNYAVPYL